MALHGSTPVHTSAAASAFRSTTSSTPTEHTGATIPTAQNLGLANNQIVGQRDQGQGQGGQGQGGNGGSAGNGTARVQDRATLAAQVALGRNAAVSPLLSRGVENVPTAFTRSAYFGRTTSGYSMAFSSKTASVTGRNSNFMLSTGGPQVALSGGEDDGVPSSWAQQIRGGFAAAYTAGARQGLSVSPNA
jgi:hypothetical protein